MKPPKVIAEIGCNHKGDIEIAREMIGIAVTFAKCDFVKFQKRSNRELLTHEEYNAFHPNPQNSYGDSYGAHREFLEFDVDQHRQLQQWCRDLGIGYSTSVWDLTSAREIASLNPEFIKVPSACNLNFPMLEYLAKNYSGDIHISVGMTTVATVDAGPRRTQGIHDERHSCHHNCFVDLDGMRCILHTYINSLFERF